MSFTNLKSHLPGNLDITEDKEMSYIALFDLLMSAGDEISTESLVGRLVTAISDFFSKDGSKTPQIVSSFGLGKQTELQRYLAVNNRHHTMVFGMSLTDIADWQFVIPKGMTCDYISSVKTCAEIHKAIKIQETVGDIDRAILLLQKGMVAQNPGAFEVLVPVLRSLAQPTKKSEVDVSRLINSTFGGSGTDSDEIEYLISTAFSEAELRDAEKKYFEFDGESSAPIVFKKCFKSMADYVTTRIELLKLSPLLGLASDKLKKQLQFMSVTITEITKMLEFDAQEKYSRQHIISFGAVVQILAIRLRYFGLICATQVKLEHNYSVGTEMIYQRQISPKV